MRTQVGAAEIGYGLIEPEDGEPLVPTMECGDN
jgi:hypothetical protein